ncbi:hypothetical protein GCM10027174_09690 [Salinifilum aidingensis]
MAERRDRDRTIEVNTAAYLLERGELDDDVPDSGPSDFAEGPRGRGCSRPDSGAAGDGTAADSRAGDR